MKFLIFKIEKYKGKLTDTLSEDDVFGVATEEYWLKRGMSACQLSHC